MLPFILLNVVLFFGSDAFEILIFLLIHFLFILFIPDNDDVWVLNIILNFLEPVFKTILEGLFVQIIKKKNYVWTL